MTPRNKVGHAEKVEDFRVDAFLEAVANVFKTYGLVLITPLSDDAIVCEPLPNANEDFSWVQDEDVAISASVQHVSYDLPVPVGA